MPSYETIQRVFDRFQARGILSPEVWRTGTQDQRDRAMALSVATYADDLAGLTDEQFVAAAKTYALSGERFWPTPGQLLALVPTDPSVELLRSGDLAWGYLTSNRHRWGTYSWPWREAGPPQDGRTRLHADPDVEAALWAGIDAVGGWQGWCAMRVEGVAAERAAFRTAYEATIAARKPALQARLALAATNRPALPDGGGR